MSNIAIVIPTARPESWDKFWKSWVKLFRLHDCYIYKVEDGDTQTVLEWIPTSYDSDSWLEHTPKQILGDNVDLVFNKTPACRNLGFAAIAKFNSAVKYIITLDDDLESLGDPIQDHIDALNMNVPISWMSTIDVYDDTEYPRGFPYWVKQEAPVMLSHGVWQGVADWDAPTQLVMGEKRVVMFRRGPIPKGVYFPFCGMNVAFRREALPYIYYAPVANFYGAERFDDIWAGIEFKRDFDRLDWAVVTGYAEVQHNRASNVWKNLQRESVGLELNEHYWQKKPDHPWFDEYLEKRNRWKEMIQSW